MEGCQQVYFIQRSQPLAHFLCITSECLHLMDSSHLFENILYQGEKIQNEKLFLLSTLQVKYTLAI